MNSLGKAAQAEAAQAAPADPGGLPAGSLVGPHLTRWLSAALPLQDWKAGAEWLVQAESVSEPMPTESGGGGWVGGGGGGTLLAVRILIKGCRCSSLACCPELQSVSLSSSIQSDMLAMAVQSGWLAMAELS